MRRSEPTSRPPRVTKDGAGSGVQCGRNLRELAVERDRRETERAEHHSEPLGARARCREDNRGMTGQLVADVREVAVLTRKSRAQGWWGILYVMPGLVLKAALDLVLGGDEEVLLDERLDGTVLGGDLHLDPTRRTQPGPHAVNGRPRDASAVRGSNNRGPTTREGPLGTAR